MPTPERARRGKFERVVPDGLLAGGGRKVWRDEHCDAVHRMAARGDLADVHLAAALRFAALARQAMGPVRLARSGMRDRVDGGTLAGEDEQADRLIAAKAAWAAAGAALRGDERKTLVEILYFERPLGEVAVRMFGGRWSGANARNAAAQAVIRTGLEGLAVHWGLIGG